MKIEVWSDQKVMSYLFCPYSFLLRVSNSEPIRGITSKYGIAIHDTIFEFWEHDFKDPSELSDFWWDYWDRIRKEELEKNPWRFRESEWKELGERGARILEDFYRKNVWKKERGKLITFRKLGANYEGLNLSVKFDEIFACDGEVHLVDYTTTRQHPKQVHKRLSTHPTILMMYVIFKKASHILFPDEEIGEIKVGKNMLYWNEEVLREVAEEDVKRFFSTLKGIDKKVRNDEFPPNFGPRCKRCYFFTAHWKSSRRDRTFLSKYGKPEVGYPLIFQQASS